MWEDYDDNYQCGYRYDEREDDIYSGQYHDGEDEWADNPINDYYESERFKEKQVKQQWIELDTDPFSNSEYPKEKQRVLLWNNLHQECYATQFRSNVEWKILGYTHWMPVPEGPVKLLKFSEVLQGIKGDKSYRRKKWTPDKQNLEFNSRTTITVADMRAEDWIEVG